MSRPEIARQLRAFIVEEILRSPSYPLGEGDPLLTGGVLDSLALTRIAVFVEGAFGVVIPDSELSAERMDTLDQMVSRVVESAAGR